MSISAFSSGGGGSLGTIGIGISIDQDMMLKGFGNLNKRLDAMVTKTKGTSKATTVASSSMVGAWAAVGVSIGAVVGSASALVAVMGKLKVAAQAAAYSKDATSVFEGMGYDLKVFRDATKGLIDDTTLVTSMNLAENMGITGNEYTELANIADAAAKKTGQSQMYMFNSIMTGTARSSKLILDNLGIMVSWDKAHEKYAKSIGKSTNKLTDQEKKQAEVNMVLEKGRQIIKDVADGGADAGDAWDLFDAQLTNFKGNLAALVETEGRGFIMFLADVLKYLNAIDFSKVFEFFNSKESQKALMIDYSSEKGLHMKGLPEGGFMLGESKNEKIVSDFAEATKMLKMFRKYGYSEERLKKEGKLDEYDKAKAAFDKMRGAMDRRRKTGEDGLSEGEKKERERTFKRKTDERKKVSDAFQEMLAGLKADIASFGGDSLSNAVREIFQQNLESENEAIELFPNAKDESSRNRLLDLSDERLRLQAQELLNSSTSLEEFNRALELISQNASEYLVDVDSDKLAKDAGLLKARLIAEAFSGAAQEEPEDKSLLYERQRQAMSLDREEKAKQNQENKQVVGESVVSAMLRNGLDPGSMMLAAASAFDPLAGEIVSAVLQGLQMVGDMIVGALVSLLFDSRLQGAADAGISSGASVMMGTAAAVIIGLVTSSITAPLAVLALVFLPLTIAVATLTAMFVILVSFVSALIFAIPLLLGGVAGLYVAFFELSKSSEGYARFSEAISYLADEIVNATSPLWDNMTALIGLFDGVSRVLATLFATIASNEALVWVLFNAFKLTALVMLSFVGVIIGVNNIIMNVMGFLLSFIPGMSALSAALYSAAIDTDGYDAQMRSLREMTYAEAESRGENVRSIIEEESARSALVDGSVNMPSGYRVEGPKFDAQDPTVGTNGSGGVTNNFYGDILIPTRGQDVQKEIVDFFRKTRGNAYAGKGAV